MRLTNRLTNPSELGPWNRFEDHNDPSEYLQTKNSNFKQQLIFPRMTRRKHNIIKERQSKQKVYEAIKIRPMELQVSSKNKINPLTNQLEIVDGRKSQTLSFDTPKIVKSGKNFRVLSKSKQKVGVFGQTYNEEENEHKITHKMSKIDLIVELIQNNQKQEQKSPKTIKVKQYQFSKKRSLMQLLRYLKHSTHASMSDRGGGQRQRNGRYDGYRYLANISPKGQSIYLPYFNTKKPNNPTKNKRVSM